MLTREITYKNPFTEQPVTETHYFHISKTDLVEMEIEEHDQAYIAKTDSPESGIKSGEELTGMRAKLQRIQESKDGKAILHEMKDMIRRSFLIRDGDKAIKNEEVQKEFMAGEAFSQLLFELCTNPEEMAMFMSGIIPSNLAEIASDIQAQAEKVAAGRAAQETAKAAGAASAEAAAPAPEPAADTPEEATAPSPSATDNVPSREQVIEAATSENPVTLTEAEVRAIPHEQLKSGLADGRFKLS